MSTSIDMEMCTEFQIQSIFCRATYGKTGYLKFLLIKSEVNLQTQANCQL